jgi:predicted DCC family thiol-disulfide oxidoreductase YuxK
MRIAEHDVQWMLCGEWTERTIAREEVMVRIEGKTTLIYDGNCPVCTSTIKWIHENEIEGSFDLIPCQSAAKADRFPGVDAAACMQAIHLVMPDGRVLAAEQTLPEIMKRLRRFRIAAVLFKIPGTMFLSSRIYRWFAPRRYDIAELISHVLGAKRSYINPHKPGNHGSSL